MMIRGDRGRRIGARIEDGYAHPAVKVGQERERDRSDAVGGVATDRSSTCGNFDRPELRVWSE